MDERTNDRPLAPLFQDAEDRFNARLLILERAAKNAGAKRSYAVVLRWYLEQNADERRVIARQRRIAGSYWVGLSERTVQRAHAFWREVGVLTFAARAADNGANLPPWASLDWDAVLSLAGAPRGTAHARHTVGADATREVTESGRHSTMDAGRSFVRRSVSGDGGLSPGGGVLSPGGGDMTPGLSPGVERAEIPPRAIYPAPVRACGLSVSCLSVVVENLNFNNNNQTDGPRERAEALAVEIDGKQRTATRSAIEELARRIGRAIWANGSPYEALPTLYAAAAAAQLVLGEDWATAAMKAAHEAIHTAVPPIRNRLAFFRGVLVNLAESRAGAGPFATRADGKTWLDTLLWPFQEKIAAWLPPPPAPKPPPAPIDRAAELAAARAEYAEHGTLKDRLLAARAAQSTEAAP